MYEKSKDTFDKSVERVRLGLDNGTWVDGESVNLLNRDIWTRFEIKGEYSPSGAVLSITQGGKDLIYGERRQKDGPVTSTVNYADVSNYVGNTQKDMCDKDLVYHDISVLSEICTRSSRPKLPDTWFSTENYKDPKCDYMCGPEILEEDFKKFVDSLPKYHVSFVDVNNPKNNYSVDLSYSIEKRRISDGYRAPDDLDSIKPSDSIYIRSDIPGDYIIRQSQKNQKEYVTGMATGEDGKPSLMTFGRTFGGYTFTKNEIGSLLKGDSLDIPMRSGERAVKLGTYERNGKSYSGVVFDDAAKQRDLPDLAAGAEAAKDNQLE